MLIDLSESDGRPIYGRIADRIKFAIAGEVLRPGELAPSVRELSKQLVVNPNTVARAYRDLQGEGLLEPVRGTGLQVTRGATERCRLARVDYVRGRLRAAFEEARETGLPAVEIEAILHEEWSRGRGDGNQSNGKGADRG
jgi:GntR family transcriptional regulator